MLTEKEHLHLMLKLYDRIIKGSIQMHAVFETWYKTASGDWTQDAEKADWQRFHGLPTGALMVDTKYEQYWQIAGKRYDNYDNAYDAADYELVKPYLFLPLLAWAKKNKKAIT